VVRGRCECVVVSCVGVVASASSSSMVAVSFGVVIVVEVVVALLSARMGIVVVVVGGVGALSVLGEVSVVGRMQRAGGSLHVEGTT